MQKRGAAIIEARGQSSAASAANAAINHVQTWYNGTAAGDWVSMGIPSTGAYGSAEGVIFSYPVTVKNGVYTIVEGLQLSDFDKQMIAATGQELLEERAAIEEMLGVNARGRFMSPGLQATRLRSPVPGDILLNRVTRRSPHVPTPPAGAVMRVYCMK